MTKPSVSFNPKHDLPYMAAISQTAQFALAGSILLGPRGWLFGGLLGLLISVTMAYATSQYADIAEKRKPFAMAMILCLGIFSPVIIGTSMYLDLPKDINEIWRGIVGAVWGILPDLSVALTGFVAGKGLVKREEKQLEQTAEQPKAKTKAHTPLYSCSQCAWTSSEAEKAGKDAKKAFSGHKLKHKLIPVDSGSVFGKGS